MGYWEGEGGSGRSWGGSWGWIWFKIHCMKFSKRIKILLKKKTSYSQKTAFLRAKVSSVIQCLPSLWEAPLLGKKGSPPVADGAKKLPHRVKDT